MRNEYMKKENQSGKSEYSARNSHKFPSNPKKLLRLGCAALALMLVVCAAPLLRRSFDLQLPVVYGAINNDSSITCHTSDTKDIIDTYPAVKEINVDVNGTLNITETAVITMVNGSGNNDESEIQVYGGATINLYGRISGVFDKFSVSSANASFNIFLCDGAVFDAEFDHEDSLVIGHSNLTCYGCNYGSNVPNAVVVKDSNGNSVTSSTTGTFNITNPGPVYTITANPVSGRSEVVWTKGPRGEVLKTDESGTPMVVVNENEVQIRLKENAKYQVYAYYIPDPEWEWNDDNEATLKISSYDPNEEDGIGVQLYTDTDVTAVETPGTCTEDGYTTYTASIEIDGHTYTTTGEDIRVVTNTGSALGHDWGEWYDIIPATCTEAGQHTHACQRDGCSVTETEAIPPHGHSLVKIDAHAATCDAPGNTEYWTCQRCGQIFGEEDALVSISINITEIPALGHNLEKTDAKAATCEVPGNIEYWTCQRCGKLFGDHDASEELEAENTVIDALGHSLEKIDAKAATCEVPGNIEYWACQRCGKLFGDPDASEEIAQTATVAPALGHDWGEWEVTKEPTATEEGSRTRQCKKDPTHTQTEAIPATGIFYRYVPDGTADDEVASAEDPTYKWRKNSGKNQLFVVKSVSNDAGTFDKLLQVLVDGEEIDDSRYTADPGSLRLTLKAPYLQTLSIGDHTLTTRFTDGEVTHIFTVLPPSGGTDSPVTGESNTAVAVNAVLMILAATGAGYAVYRSKKSPRNLFHH